MGAMATSWPLDSTDRDLQPALPLPALSLGTVGLAQQLWGLPRTVCTARSPQELLDLGLRRPLLSTASLGCGR